MTIRTQEQIEARRAYQRKYGVSPKGRATQRRWDASPKGKAAKRRLAASPEGRAYQREYNNSPGHKAKRKAQYDKRKAMAREYLGGVCVGCGTDEGLEFDHVDSETKSYGISGRSTIAWETIVKELAKCQLLCHTCHVVKTKEDRSD